MANYDLTYEGSRVQNILDTGDELRDAGYIFHGEATPSTVPGTPTERVAYIGGPGTYTNFGSSITVGAGCICVFKYTGSAWSNQVINTGLDSAVNTLQSAITAINNNIGNGYVYAGVATPSTSPVTGKVFYLAVQAGTYTNFGNAVVTAGLNVIKYNGSVWSVDQVIAIDAEPTQGSANLVKSGGVLGSIIQNGPAFDLSAYNAQGGVLATYADLSAALTALNALPADFKKGGMSMKFVLSSDNKYVQWRLMANQWSTTESDWQGVDDEPIEGSENLVKSGGVALINALRLSIEGTITQENPTGAGVAKDFKVIPNKPFTVVFTNPNWDRSNYTGGSYILTIGYRDSQGFHDIIAKLRNQTIDTQYTITPQSENAYVFVRANDGEKVNFSVYESELIATIPELAQDIANNAQDIANSTQELNGKTFLNYHCFLASGGAITKYFNYDYTLSVKIVGKLVILVESFYSKVYDFGSDGRTFTLPFNGSLGYNRTTDTWEVHGDGYQGYNNTNICMLHYNAQTKTYGGVLESLLLELDKVDFDKLNTINGTINGTITQDNPTGAGVRFDFKAIPNKPCNVIINNPNWDRSNYTGGSYILTIGYNDNQGFHDVIAKLRNQTIDTLYTFTPLTENAYVFARANAGETVSFKIIESELVATLPELKTATDTNRTEIAEIKENVNIYDGTAPYLGEKININTLKYVLSAYKFNQVNSYFQGFTRNKDYAIAIENGSYIHIHSAIDDSELGAYQLPVQYHASCCFFSNEKYDEADPMPILFVTGTYDGAQTNITGFRIGFESATQVQNITFTKQSEDSGYIVDVVGFDRDTNKVYVVALTSLNMQSSGNNYIFYQYNMPTLSQGAEVALSVPNLIGSIPFPDFFEFTQTEYANPQAITAYNGQLFLHVGRSSINSNLLFVIDISTGTLKNMIRYGRDIRQEEAEGNVVFDGKYYNMAVTTGRVTSVVFE